MDGNAPWNAGLGLAQIEPGKRLSILVENLLRLMMSSTARISVASMCARTSRAAP
jgi:hypothetical protein